MRRLVLRITRRLVLVPLLYVGWRLVILARKMGIGASLPDRVIRAIDFNDVKALDDVRPAAPAAPAAARALARAAAFGLTGAGAARADAGSLPAAGRAAAAGDAGHGPRPPAVVAAHVRGRQRLVRLRRRGALPGRRQALAVPASRGARAAVPAWCVSDNGWRRACEPLLYELRRAHLLCSRREQQHQAVCVAATSAASAMQHAPLAGWCTLGDARRCTTRASLSSFLRRTRQHARTASFAAAACGRRPAHADLCTPGAGACVRQRCHCGRVSPPGAHPALTGAAVPRQLLRAGANVQAIGEEGSTALHEAIMRGRQREALLLLSAGANPFCENARGAPRLRRVGLGLLPHHARAARGCAARRSQARLPRCPPSSAPRHRRPAPALRPAAPRRETRGAGGGPGLTAIDVAINAKSLALVRQLEGRAPFAGYLAMKVPKFMGLGSEWKARCGPYPNGQP